MASYRYKLDKKSLYAIIPVRITNPETQLAVITDCLIDTGAMDSMFPGGLATITGHNLKGVGVASNETRGVMGKNMVVWSHSFIIEILTANRDRVIWKSKKLLIACAEHDNCPPLLGARDVLKNFGLTINYKSGNFILNL